MNTGWYKVILSETGTADTGLTYFVKADNTPLIELLCKKQKLMNQGYTDNLGFGVWKGIIK